MSSSISSISATLGGTISSDGGSAILERGVVFSQSVTNADPSIGGPGTTGHIAASAGTGMFTVSVSGLVPGTGYSFKAYATNAKGTGYSSLATFTTAANQPPALAVDGAGSTPAFTFTSPLATARAYHMAVLLSNGKVLVAGGETNSGKTAHAEIYDPADGAWTATGSMVAPRYAHTATLLPNGKVLVAGGLNGTGALAGAEIYDPATGVWTTTGSLALARLYHTGTLLANGKVLVTGGRGAGGGFLDNAEIYDPATGSWISGRAFSRQRYRHTATLLASGKVLITGGYNAEGFTPITTSALYDPVANNWSAAASLNTGRLTHTATLLADGRILIAGGNTEIVSNPLASAEIYSPPGPVISTGEGQSATKTGTFSDAEGNATVTIQASSGAITQNNPAGTWSWTATGEDGPATSNVIVTALDTPGGVSRATFTFSVTNRPPTAGVTGPAVAVAGVPVGFSFTAAQRIGSNLVLTFPEPPGVAGSVIYRAESSTDLSSGNWFPVADTGTGGIHTFRVPMAGRPKVFIRLVVTEP